MEIIPVLIGWGCFGGNFDTASPWRGKFAASLFMLLLPA